MKTLIFILLVALFIFQSSYTQEVEELEGEIEVGPEEETVEEEIPGNEVEVFPEEENEQEAVEVILEEENIGEAEEVVPEEENVGESEEEAIGEEEVEVIPEEENVVEVESETEVEDSWTNVDLTEFSNDPFGQKVLYFGAQWIISQLIGYNVIPNNSNWNVSVVNWVSTQPAADGINYRINGLFTRGQRDSFTGEIIVNADSSINRTVVISTAYTLGTEEENASNLENAEVIVTELEAENIDEAPVLVEAEAAVQGETEVTVVGDWEDLDLVQAVNDPNIQTLLTQGADFAINKGLVEGTLPVAAWTVSVVPQITRQVAQGTNYRFAMVFTSHTNMGAKAQVFAFQNTGGNIFIITSGFWAIAPVENL